MTSSPQSRLFSDEAETARVVEKLVTLSYTEAFARGLVDALTDSFNVTTTQAFGAPTAHAALESLKNTSNKTPPRILSSLASHMLAHELAVSLGFTTGNVTTLIGAINGADHHALVLNYM